MKSYCTKFLPDCTVIVTFSHPTSHVMLGLNHQSSTDAINRCGLAQGDKRASQRDSIHGSLHPIPLALCSIQTCMATRLWHHFRGARSKIQLPTIVSHNLNGMAKLVHKE